MRAKNTGNPFLLSAHEPNSPPRQSRSCGSVAEFSELGGRILSKAKTRGMNDGQKDRNCCALCLANERCEFWERSSEECFLKREFEGKFLKSSHLESASNDGKGEDGEDGEDELEDSPAATSGEFRFQKVHAVDVYAAPPVEGGRGESGNGVEAQRRGGFVNQANSGVWFVRSGHVMDGGGSGEVLASLLGEMAFRRGLRVLTHRACYAEADNQLGQSSCDCPRLVSLSDLPAKDPAAKLGSYADPWITFPDAAHGLHQYQIILSAMFYHPELQAPFLTHEASHRKVKCCALTATDVSVFDVLILLFILLTPPSTDHAPDGSPQQNHLGL